MNTPDGTMLRLPVLPWPTTFNQEGFRHATFSGEARWGADELVGKSIGTEAFYERGWTPEKFAQFVTSRRDLHVELDGQLCPTLAALAGYLKSPILVSDCRGENWTLWFITNWGEVTTAEFAGNHEVVTEVVRAFFRDGLESVLSLPHLKVRTSNPNESESVEERAAVQQLRLNDWKLAHAGGNLVAPEGAEVSSADLIIVPRDVLDVERPVLAHARSSKHLYEVILPVTDEAPPSTVLCAVDGATQGFVDPATGVEKGLGADASDWAEWILKNSVSDEHRSARQPWEGDSTEAGLYRLAHNIVNYEVHEAETSQFTTASKLGAWLKKSLGNHNAPIRVHLLDDVSFVLKSNRMPLVEEHSFDRSSSPEVKARYQANMFLPWAGVQNWFSSGHGGYSRNPSLQTTMDGRTLETFMAMNCLDYAALECDLLPGDTRVNENSWFLVSLEDTRTCIAFPAAGSMLQVSTDHDGASALITAREHSSRAEELNREHFFKTQWARWLEDDNQLTKEEIQEGLRTLGQIIEECSA
jgi:hypothetical protein